MVFASTCVTSQLTVFLAFDPIRESDLHETQFSFPIAVNKHLNHIDSLEEV